MLRLGGWRANGSDLLKYKSRLSNAKVQLALFSDSRIWQQPLEQREGSSEEGPKRKGFTGGQGEEAGRCHKRRKGTVPGQATFFWGKGRQGSSHTSDLTGAGQALRAVSLKVPFLGELETAMNRNQQKLLSWGGQMTPFRACYFFLIDLSIKDRKMVVPESAPPDQRRVCKAHV